MSSTYILSLFYKNFPFLIERVNFPLFLFYRAAPTKFLNSVSFFTNLRLQPACLTGNRLQSPFSLIIQWLLEGDSSRNKKIFSLSKELCRGQPPVDMYFIYLYLFVISLFFIKELVVLSLNNDTTLCSWFFREGLPRIWRHLPEEVFWANPRPLNHTCPPPDLLTPALAQFLAFIFGKQDNKTSGEITIDWPSVEWSPKDEILARQTQPDQSVPPNSSSPSGPQLGLNQTTHPRSPFCLPGHLGELFDS